MNNCNKSEEVPLEAENALDFEEEEAKEPKNDNPSIWAVAAFMRTRLA